jgi:hypothetical protein
LIDIGWFYRASEDIQRSNQWSYLVTVTDENDITHNYYFRVSYDLSVIEYKQIVDSVVYDIDGNGKNEVCEITEERKDGEYKVYLSIIKDGNGTKIYKELGRGNAFSRFTVKTDGLYIDCPDYTSSFAIMPINRYKVYIVNDEIELTKGTSIFTQFTPTLSTAWKDDFGANEGKTEFKADHFLQGVNLSWSYSINVSVDNGNIYLDGVLYKESYKQSHGVLVDEALIADAKTKDREEILNKIRDADFCYELTTDEETKLGQRIAVYKIDRTYYFVNFYENGNVLRIHSAKIP